MATSPAKAPQRIPRPPIIAVMGHIDHGKSTLLDHIRETNVVAAEAGGITQHLSAYEIEHAVKDPTDKTGKAKIERNITFLDTPGHEAFEQMRSRGAKVADIALLVVAADDGIKAQTLEALRSIKNAGIPYIVAINKIDKPEANVERTKNQLLEEGVYLEGLGGDVPWAAVSAKTGEGISELLDLVLLLADMQEFSGDPTKPAESVVIEAHVDPKKGISATLIIRDGILRKGMYVVVGGAKAPVRIMENSWGQSIDEATFSSPVLIAGFNEVPQIGAPCQAYENKKEAEKAASENGATSRTAVKANATNGRTSEEEHVTIPLIVKADRSGTLDAVEHSIAQIAVERVDTRIVHRGIGTITDTDIKASGGDANTLVIGFNVGIDATAKDAAERIGITIQTFDIIYELVDWLAIALKERAPKVETIEVTGRARVLKTFSSTKDKHIIGGRVEEGAFVAGATCRIMRRGTEIGTGKILNLQQQKADAQRVETDNEFGAQIQSRTEIAPGDSLESLIVTKT